MAVIFIRRGSVTRGESLREDGLRDRTAGFEMKLVGDWPKLDGKLEEERD